MKISERDKLIVKWFGLFLIVVGVWFLGLEPFRKQIDILSEEKLNLETRKAVVETTILEEPQVAAQQKKALSQIQERFERYTLFSSAADVEAFLIPLILPYNISFDYFGITQPQVIAPVTTLKTRSNFAYRLKALVDEYDQIGSIQTEVPTTDSNLILVQITYLLRLSFEDYQNLITAIDQLDHALLLSKSSYDIEDGIGELTFDLYMTDKPEFK